MYIIKDVTTLPINAFKLAGHVSKTICLICLHCFSFVVSYYTHILHQNVTYQNMIYVTLHQ